MCARHGGDCHPCTQNRIATMQRSGQYIKSLPDQPMYTLCNMPDRNGYLKGSTIRDIMGQGVWPVQKVMSKHDVFNINVKIHRLLPILKSTAGDFEQFQLIANSNGILSGLETNMSLDDDEAYAMSHNVLLEVQNSIDGSGEDAIFKFVDYLELIAECTKGFTYKLAENSTGNKRKLTGVVGGQLQCGAILNCLGITSSLT